MPPKSVTCSVCNETVLKAQTLARADGTRACRSHEGVTAEADARIVLERVRRQAAIDKGTIVDQWARERRVEEQANYANWEAEGVKFREYIYSHCWACATEGLEWQTFWTQALIASKRLQLRGEFNFLNYGQDVRKLMGNIALLAPIKWQNEVIDRAIVKHLYKKVREIVPVIGFFLICPECARKHGFGKRLEDLMPKPTWEQLENMSAVMSGVEPLVTAMAEKKEHQS